MFDWMKEKWMKKTGRKIRKQINDVRKEGKNEFKYN